MLLLENEHIVCQLSEHNNRLKNLESYQDKQNGTIGKVKKGVDKVNDRVDEIYVFILSALITAAGGLIGIIFMLYKLLRVLEG